MLKRFIFKQLSKIFDFLEKLLYGELPKIEDMEEKLHDMERENEELMTYVENLKDRLSEYEYVG